MKRALILIAIAAVTAYAAVHHDVRLTAAGVIVMAAWWGWRRITRRFSRKGRS